MKRMLRILALMMALLLLAACSDKSSGQTQPSTSHSGEGGTTLPGIGSTQREPIHAAQSKEELFRLFSAASADDPIPDAPGEDDTADFPANDEGATQAAAGYEQNNFVKSDSGKLYILGAADFKILAANGKDTALLSTTNILTAGTSNFETTDALYVFGNMVAVISTVEVFNDSDGQMNYEDLCNVKLYDVTDPKAPKLKDSFVQDGSYRNSYMVQGRLVVASEDYKFSPQQELDKSYLPCVWDGEAAQALAPERIFVCPDESANAYTIVSTVDMTSAQREDSCAFTGESKSIYMDDTGVYLARTVSNREVSEPYTEEQYTVVSVKSNVQTEVKMLTFDTGSLNMEAYAYVDGQLANRYAMNVYNGNLRLATASEQSNYQIYTDEKYGWSNYRVGESSASNNIFVFDAALQQIGALTELAPGAQLSTVWFVENTAYVQADKAFAVDLRDASALKAVEQTEQKMACSDMRLYQPGTLFALGVDESVTLQTALLDASDPGNVQVRAQLALQDYDWNNAANHPHALAADAALGVIALPVDGAYAVLSCDGQSLKLQGTVPFAALSDRTRGIFVDNMLYLCDPQMVTVAAADTLTVLANIGFGVG